MICACHTFARTIYVRTREDVVHVHRKPFEASGIHYLT